MKWKQLVLILFLVEGIQIVTSRDINDRDCEPIRIELCKNIGYNLTSMPNLVGNELQTEADYMLQTFLPLIQYGCSAQLHFFLCAAYAPMCTQKVPFPIGPCRGLCETVRERCHPLLHGFGFPWPPALDCNRFPKENNHEHMCMVGPGENDSPPTTIASPKIQPQPTCQLLAKSHLYVKLNRSDQCAPLCDADILFDTKEKYTAEIWLTTWTLAAVFIALIAILCLIFTDTKWNKVLIPLMTCHSLVAIGWVVRWIAGRNQTACGHDPQLPTVLILLTDGLSNAPCATNFLLRYYFGMSACVWWAILCLKWHLTVRRIRDQTIAELPAEKNKETHGNLTLLAAWGLPALQTVAVLVTQLIDADELLGACFVGNQSEKGLRVLVAMPLFCYWIFGAVNLFVGYLVQRLKKAKFKFPATLNGMGSFLFAYCIPSTILLFTVFYEFVNRDTWLNLPPHPAVDTSNGGGPMWPFMLRAFMELLLGVLTSAWVLGPRISKWRTKKDNQFKQTPKPYISSAYSRTSYQTVCPPNSLGSQSIKIHRHGGKYPLHHVAAHKPRSYKLSSHHSHSISLTGNETVF